jgi:Amt family ammonium transporter
MAVNDVTVAAFLNTDIAASFAGVTWLIIEWNTGKKKPTFIGLMTGAVAGLATITPAAGYVTIQSAVIIGIIAGVGCYLAVKFKERKNWDDALDVWGVHGMGGVIGTICLGLFATKTINQNGVDGLFYGFLKGRTGWFGFQLPRRGCTRYSMILGINKKEGKTSPGELSSGLVF